MMMTAQQTEHVRATDLLCRRSDFMDRLRVDPTFGSESFSKLLKTELLATY